MTSITNGVHSQATMNVTLPSGNEENHATAGKPTKWSAQSTIPLDGLRKRFFHNKAMTDGVTKNGTVARPRKTFLPQIGRFNSSASSVPATSARVIAPTTSSKVWPMMGQKFGSPVKVVM